VTVKPDGMTVVQISDGICPFSHVDALSKSPLAIAVHIGFVAGVPAVVDSIK